MRGGPGKVRKAEHMHEEDIWWFTHWWVHQFCISENPTIDAHAYPPRQQTTEQTKKINKYFGTISLSHFSLSSSLSFHPTLKKCIFELLKEKTENEMKINSLSVFILVSISSFWQISVRIQKVCTYVSFIPLGRKRTKYEFKFRVTIIIFQYNILKNYIYINHLAIIKA